MIEQLKAIELEKLSKEEVLEHRKNVLELKDEALIVEYLKFALDSFYKSEDEGENIEGVTIFFEAEEFKPYYTVILTSEEE